MITDQQIISANSLEEVLEIQRTLYTEKMKLDKFFSMFLEKFERKMDADETDTAIWKLYNAKLKEYDAIQRGIRTSTYYANKRSANI